MKRLKIALINPPLPGHKQRGIGTYTEELFNALKKADEIDIVAVDINQNLSKFDLIHYPYFDPFFLTLPIVKDKPTIVTVHDLIPLNYPDKFPRGLRGEIKWFVQKQSLKAAKNIITDSYASKKDIVKFTGISEEKINVIYLGVREEFKVIKSQKILDEVKVKYSLPKKFILYVGDVNYNKNILGIIKSFSEVTKKNKDINLILVGNGFINDSIQLSEINNLISEFRLKEKVKKIGYIALSDLVGVYNLAKVYLQPSFAEGFGLPVLEAIACGCPVVTSNISSLPELVDDAALLVDPKNAEDIVKSILKIIDNSTLREAITKRGLQRVREFNWVRCASETLNIYKKVIQ